MALPKLSLSADSLSKLSTSDSISTAVSLLIFVKDTRLLDMIFNQQQILYKNRKYNPIPFQVNNLPDCLKSNQA